MARRRKEDRRAGSASRGMVRRLGRGSSRVRHRVVPERDRVPDGDNAAGAAVDVYSDAPAGAQRAERAAEGGDVDVSRALSGRCQVNWGTFFIPAPAPRTKSIIDS